jgi:hypothetical protein
MATVLRKSQYLSHFYLDGELQKEFLLIILREVQFSECVRILQITMVHSRKLWCPCPQKTSH